MAENDIALMAHLMRRAAFGAPYEELEARAAKGYAATLMNCSIPKRSLMGSTWMCWSGTSSNGRG
jgi:hypothetical protein